MNEKAKYYIPSITTSPTTFPGDGSGVQTMCWHSAFPHFYQKSCRAEVKQTKMVETVTCLWGLRSCIYKPGHVLSWAVARQVLRVGRSTVMCWGWAGPANVYKLGHALSWTVAPSCVEGGQVQLSHNDTVYMHVLDDSLDPQNHPQNWGSSYT